MNSSGLQVILRPLVGGQRLENDFLSFYEGGTYCSSVVSIELVILTQGSSWYNHTRIQCLIVGYGIMTPQETNNGIEIAELNNIPT